MTDRERKELDFVESKRPAATTFGPADTSDLHAYKSQLQNLKREKVR